jgi:hypothetical protein
MKRDEDEQKPPREQRESFTRRREHISRSLTFFPGNSSAEISGDFCTEISSPKREKL